jgi:dCTP deaminase
MYYYIQYLLSECVLCKGEYDKTNEICNKCGLSNIPRTFVDWEIEKLVKMHIIKILPTLDLEHQLGPTGLDLTLDTKFKIIKKNENIYVDPIEKYIPERRYEDIELLLSNNDFFVLHPGEFTLGQSFEFISLPDNISAGLDGKSSLGRLSLTVHTTAASVDPGFTGHITFELFNAGGLPMKIHPLQPVARLVFHLTNKVRTRYSGDYSFQTEVRPSQYHTSYFSKILKKHPNHLP